MGEYLGVYSTGDTGCLSAPKDFPKDLSSEQMWPSCFRALPVDWALDPLLRVAWQVEGALDSGHVANNFCVNKPPCAIGYQLLEKRIQVILVIQGSEVINPHNMDPRTSLLPQSLLVAGRSWSSGQGQRPFKHRELAGLGVPGNAPSWSRHRSFDL